MKARTIDAIRRRGAFERPPATSRRTLALVAVACLIFVAGTLAGYAFAQRATLPNDEARTTRQAVARAENQSTNNPPTRQVIWY